MNNINIEKKQTKHGLLNFLSSDMYIGKSLKAYGEYSEIELSIIMSFINENDVVFDIGSNIGAFSIPFAKKVGNRGKVFCFEPQNLIYELLKKNVQDNKFANVKLYQNGIGEKKSTIDLNLIDYSVMDNFGGISLVQTEKNPFFPGKEDPKQKIQIKMLDDFLSLKKCNLLKIDVESMEIDVLNGGKKFIKKFRPIMWIENQRIFPNSLNKFILNLDYNIYWVLSYLYNPNNHFRTQLNFFPNICTENILAIPKEKDDFIQTKNFDQVINEKTPPKKIFWTTKISKTN